MNRKIVELLEGGSLDELNAFFCGLTADEALKVEGVILQPEYFKAEVVKCFVKCFRFSEVAEAIFIQVAPPYLRRFYINYYGLWLTTQQDVIDKNLTEVGKELSKIRTFDDVEYLLKYGSPVMIDDFLRYHTLQEDEHVLMLARHKSKMLFHSYMSREGGCFISEAALAEIIKCELDAAFNAIVWQYGRNFKEKARLKTYAEIAKECAEDVILQDAFQCEVLKKGNPWLVEPLLKTTPLCVEAQKVLFEMNYDIQWLKIHFVNMYCVGGYRFEPEYEKRLFEVLGRNNLDDCLLEYKDRDDVIIVENAGPDTLLKYVKGRWLSNEAQVALLNRRLSEVTCAFIARFTHDHGMCSQAEVKLVELYPAEVINLYTAFHSMCGEALCLLRQKSKEGIEFYYQNHAQQ